MSLSRRSFTFRFAAAHRHNTAVGAAVIRNADWSVGGLEVADHDQSVTHFRHQLFALCGVQNNPL